MVKDLRFPFSLLLAVTLTTVGCGAPGETSEETPDDPENETFATGNAKADVVGIRDGSFEAHGVLMLANSATKTTLTKSAKLGPKAADAIVKVRLGKDGKAGTNDDGWFDSLAELDKAPYVGTTAFSALLKYAKAKAFVGSTPGRMASCAKQWDARLEAAQSTADQRAATAGLLACERTANDGSSRLVAANAKEVDSGFDASATLGSYRTAFDHLCALVLAGTQQDEGTLAPLLQTGCNIESERLLGDMLDRMVDFGDERQLPDAPEAKSRFPACYAVNEKAADEAVSTQDMMAAEYDLATCIDEGLAEVKSALVDGLVDSGTAKTEADSRLQGEFEAASSAVSGVCALFANAGSARGGTMALVGGAACNARMAAGIAELVARRTE